MALAPLCGGRNAAVGRRPAPRYNLPVSEIGVKLKEIIRWQVAFLPYLPPAAFSRPRRKSPLVYILIGCGGVVVLVGVLVVAAISFGLYKAKQAGLDPDLLQKNPAVAMVKMAVAANPDAELVSLDEDRGIVTIRDKKTGKTVTMNFEDIKQGKISFEGEGGEGSASIGGPVTLPSWFPSYPGATPQGTFSLQDRSSDSSGFHFTTKDSPAQVFQFFEAGLKKAGLTVEATGGASGGLISARDADQEREAVVNVSAASGGTQVSGTFKSKR